MTHQYSKSVWLNKQSGLTLLEIMVTIVILSLGLLGLAGLQMTGLKNNRSAYYNSVAGQVAQDIAERLRVDTGTRNGLTTTATTAHASAAKCAADVNADEFANRVACVAAPLPGGVIRIRRVADTSADYYVAATWTDLELNGANGWAADTKDNHNPATTACGAASANVSCYYMIFRP